MKLFPAEHELVWLREAQLHQVCLLRHHNVLCFVAADVLALPGGGDGNGGGGGHIQRLLITELQPLGSLRHFLRHTSSTTGLCRPVDALRLAFSCASGLCYLHTELAGSQGKPALAHRYVRLEWHQATGRWPLASPTSKLVMLARLATWLAAATKSHNKQTILLTLQQ